MKGGEAVAKKQILTNAEIEKDIVSALRHPPKESEASYQKWKIPAVLVAIFFVVIEFFYPLFLLWLLLALLGFLIAFAVVHSILFQYRIKHVSVRDYEITTEVVHSISEEHYRAERGGRIRHRRTEQINNYNIRFENGKIWRIPKELYAWSERLRKQDLGIYQTTHRGDHLLVVTKKDTGKIVVAYHTELFEYKN